MQFVRFIKNRYFVLSIFLILFSCLFIAQLYSMQIVDGQIYREKSINRIFFSYPVEASRGNIYDRNGVPLAYNREAADIYIRKAYDTSAELNASLLRLYNILKENGERFQTSLESYFTIMPFAFSGDRSWEEIASWQMSNDLFRIQEKNLHRDPFFFFQFLKEFFLISDEYNIQDAFKIMCMRYEILKMRWQYLTGEGIMIAQDVSLDTIAQIGEQVHYLRGVMIRNYKVRVYADFVYDIGHVLGYIGLVTQEDLRRDPSYAPLDFIGKTGIEAFAEQHLRGIRGYKEVETDLTGRTITEIGGIRAVNGKDVYLTIDMELQKVAMDSLRRNIGQIAGMADGKTNFGDANAGAAVVMDVRTGEILAMASYPSYDPNWFIQSDPESVKKRTEALANRFSTPMFNRAIQAGYAPGSTFKPIVAIAGLEQRLITRTSTIRCIGHEVIGDWDFYCLTFRSFGWSHGDLTIQRAMEISCNLYFYKLGVETGIDNIDYWASQFGLGERTGIDLHGEHGGNRSNRAYKSANFSEQWFVADTAQTAIGQLYSSFTPLQLVNYIAAISNGGVLHTPHVIQRVQAQTVEMILEAPGQYRRIPWSNNTFRILKESMKGVVLDGTARRVFEHFPITVAGKTGTAERGRDNESANALFISYAPYEQPEIAVVVVIERGVWGSFAAYVARDIFNAYFDLNEERED